MAEREAGKVSIPGSCFLAKSWSVCGVRGRERSEQWAAFATLGRGGGSLGCAVVEAFFVEILRRHLIGMQKFTAVHFWVGYTKRYLRMNILAAIRKTSKNGRGVGEKRSSAVAGAVTPWEVLSGLMDKVQGLLSVNST